MGGSGLAVSVSAGTMIPIVAVRSYWPKSKDVEIPTTPKNFLVGSRKVLIDKNGGEPLCCTLPASKVGFGLGWINLSPDCRRSMDTIRVRASWTRKRH